MVTLELQQQIEDFLLSKNVRHGVLVPNSRKSSNVCLTDNENVFIKVNRNYVAPLTALRAATNIDNEYIQPLIPEFKSLPNSHYVTVWDYIECKKPELTKEFLNEAVEGLFNIHITAPMFEYQSGRVLEKILQRRINKLPELAVISNIEQLIEKHVTNIYDDEPKFVLSHGDAHLGNLVNVEGKAVWIDYEQVKIIPKEWDIACLFSDLKAVNSPYAYYIVEEFNKLSPVNFKLLTNMVMARKISIATHMISRHPDMSWDEVENKLRFKDSLDF